MMLKDYSTCSSSEMLFQRCFQNAIITFMEEQKLLETLVAEHYLYRSTYNHSISDDATLKQTCHAFMEIERYCTDHHDCDGELTHIFCQELIGAITLHGQRIHIRELQIHSRGIHRN